MEPGLLAPSSGLFLPPCWLGRWGPSGSLERMNLLQPIMPVLSGGPEGSSSPGALADTLATLLPAALGNLSRGSESAMPPLWLIVKLGRGAQWQAPGRAGQMRHRDGWRDGWRDGKMDRWMGGSRAGWVMGGGHVWFPKSCYLAYGGGGREALCPS